MEGGAASAPRSAPARSAAEVARVPPAMMGGDLPQTRAVREMDSWMASEAELEVTVRTWKISSLEVSGARL